MNYELALKLEKESDFVGAYNAYLSQIDSSTPSIQNVRGLVRTTIRVGDITSLLEKLEGYCDAAKLNKDLFSLLLGKLNCEIGNVSRVGELISTIDKSQLSKNDLFEYMLLEVDLEVARNKIDEALSLIHRNRENNLNLLRRKVELEIALGKPKVAIASLKDYVAALNQNQKNQGKSGSFRTASGMLFNLANQIWLDQIFRQSENLPSLSESMQIIKNYVMKYPVNSESFFNQQNIEAHIDTTWSSVKGLGPKQRQRKALLEFVSNGISDLIELQYVTKLDWQKNFDWNRQVDYFFCEESGYISSSNFGLSRSSVVTKLWADYIDQIDAQRVPDPLDLFIGGGLITRLLASQIDKSEARFEIYSRVEMRKFRALPPRYSSPLN